jgi:tetratricopeptide (TPR) repeat protein
MLKKTILLNLLLMLLSQVAFPQAGRGRGIVRGKVVDQHYIPVVNARIKIQLLPAQDPDVVFEATTNEKGLWMIPCVGFFRWNLFASAPDYIPFQSKIKTSNFSEDKPLIKTVLRKIEEKEILGLADLKFLLDETREKLILWLAKGNTEKIDQFIQKRSKAMIREFFTALGNACIGLKQFELGLEYFKRGNNKTGPNRIGDIFFKEGNMEEALKYYKYGVASENRAIVYGQKGDRYKKLEDLTEAKEYYTEAIHDFETVIKNCTFSWEAKANKERRRIMAIMRTLPKTQPEKLREIKLKKMLKGVGRYCHKLEESSIYFFCNERVVEKVKVKIPFIELHPGTKTIKIGKKLSAWSSRTNKFTYEYQLYKEGDIIREQRHLIRAPGIQQKRRKNVSLSTLYQIHKAFFGPVGLISHNWQHYTDYRIVDEREINGEKVTIIQCIPNSRRQENHLFGDVWIRDRDYRIIKIVWFPATLGNQNNLKSLGKLYRRNPKVTFISEFGTEKGGLNFPSRCMIMEEYFDENGDGFTRVFITYKYNKYRFFKVQTDITEEKMVK